jgi:AcrR family transcriptional regulator
MPKIDAPTVAEHNQQRRTALLAAATTLLAQHGLDGVSLAAVGAAAGLARSSVYQYYDSTPALIAAVVEDVMPRTGAQLARAMAKAATPGERIDAFVRSTLSTATDPAHRSIHALEGSALPPECLARVAELHEQQYAPLLAALVELKVPQPHLTMQMVLAIVTTAARAIIAGASSKTVTARTLEVLHEGVSPQLQPHS